jgi:hypothetical protein
LYLSYVSKISEKYYNYFFTFLKLIQRVCDKGRPLRCVYKEKNFMSRWRTSLVARDLINKKRNSVTTREENTK